MSLQIRGEYPLDWKDIADRVKSEAGWRCVRCKHAAGDRWVASATRNGLVSSDTILVPCDDLCTHAKDGKLRILTVHHLDGDKGNCTWWNLLALCQVCHLSIQARVNPGQSYMHPHTPWFKIYAAGYYAFAILGEQLTRAETEARLGELLLVGQPWLNTINEE